MDMTRNEIIHVYENSQLRSDHFTAEAVTAAYVAGLAALHENAKMRDAVKGAEIIANQAKGHLTENAMLRANVADASELIRRLIARYEFDGDTDTANPCEWCSGNNCEHCRRMNDDDTQSILFELIGNPFPKEATANG